MRSALVFTAIVLACAAASLYSVAWRHGEGLLAGAGAEDSAGPATPEPIADAGSFAVAETRRERPQRAQRVKGESAPASRDESWYQYVDARGSVRFAQSLGEVPPELRSQAMRMEMSVPIQKASAPSPRRARARRPAPSLPDFDQVWGGSDAEVIIYTTSWCGACKRAIAHLEEAGIDYVEKDIEDDPAAEAEYLEKSGGRRGVPLIDVGGQIMQGYSPRGLDRALAKLG